MMDILRYRKRDFLPLREAYEAAKSTPLSDPVEWLRDRLLCRIIEARTVVPPRKSLTTMVPWTFWAVDSTAKHAIVTGKTAWKNDRGGTVPVTLFVPGEQFHDLLVPSNPDAPPPAPVGYMNTADVITAVITRNQKQVRNEIIDSPNIDKGGPTRELAERDAVRMTAEAVESGVISFMFEDRQRRLRSLPNTYGVRPLISAWLRTGRLAIGDRSVPLFAARLEVFGWLDQLGKAKEVHPQDASLGGGSKRPPKHKGGRHAGDGSIDDARLLDEMHALIKDRKAKSPNDAARQVAERAPGHSIASKVTRLGKKYRRQLDLKSDPSN